MKKRYWWIVGWIIGLLTIFVILFPNMQIGDAVCHFYFIGIMVLLFLVLIQQNKQNNILVEGGKDDNDIESVEVYIGFFHPCNLQYAQEIKQIIIDNGVCEQLVYMHTDYYDMGKEKSIISKSKRCFYILSSEALQNNEIRQIVEDILLFHLSILKKLPVYFIPVIYGVKNLDGLLLSKTCKRRIKSPLAIALKNKPILHDRLTKEAFVKQIGNLAKKKYNIKGCLWFMMLVIFIYLLFLLVIALI